MVHHSLFRRRALFVALMLTPLVWAACSSSSRQAAGGAPGQPVYGAASSEGAIQAFLDAAAAGDYPRMWAVFGTEDGAAVERFGVAEIEARMVVLARLLRHDGYEMQVANLAAYGPDRVRYEVRLQGTRKGAVVVPVVTVPDGRARWFVEQLDMDALTAGSFP